MKGHLTKRELIEYQFKLTGEGLAERIAAHLQDCGTCREHLERLKSKFAALDLLREDVEVSERLISQLLEQVSEPVKSKVVSFRRPAWIGAAAAVLLIGSLLLVSQFQKSTGPSRRAVKAPGAPAQPTPADAYQEDALKSPLTIVAKDERAEEKPLGVLEGARTRYAGVPKPKYTTAEGEPADTDFEQPPFAPASAIELVTLPRREKVQITIYNSADLTLVRERRNLTLKRGWNWLQFMWANTLIDPTSLHLEALQQKDKIDIQQLVFPARLRELGRWLIRSEVGGQVPFEITYFTSGLCWRAFYMGTLSADEQKMKLQGYVRVANNSGEDYENAQTRLIVGQVHILEEIAMLAKRQYPYGQPGVHGGLGLPGCGGYQTIDDLKVPRGAGYGMGGWGMDGIALGRKEIRKEGLSEYFLYTIEGTETIPDKWGKRLLSFEEEDIEVKSLYKYDEERWGRQAIRFVAFTNDEEHNLGKTPIPNGDVKIYGLADVQGYLSYVGGTTTKYIPVNEEIELNLGPARLVEVEPTLMDFKTANYVFDRKGNIAGWDEIRTWKVEITNTRTLAVEIEITRGFGTAYWTFETDTPYEKHDATHARFKLTVQPRTKQTFNYTVTTYHGVRQEAITE